MSNNNRKVIMMMVDGFGVPPEGWDEAVYHQYCSDKFIELFKRQSVPIDAILGIDGIPQSATGQCSLFCGVNAQEFMGHHVHAFPGKKLRDLIRSKNIFKAVKELGLKPKFANAYRKGLEDLAGTRYRSVTTVMTASDIGHVFRAAECAAGNAVFHDITNESFPEECNVPVISPEQAAHNLIGISEKYDFTLFEFFLTDRGGHKTSRDLLPGILGRLDRFVTELTDILPDNTIFILTSDHGNCEDLSTHIHTRNPVPLLVCGKNLSDDWKQIKAINQIYDYIITLLRISD